MKFVIVHIPKTGGSSIARSFKSNHILHEHQYDHYNHQTVSALITKGLIPDMDKTISLIRNPWDRMVSIYHWLQKQNQTLKELSFKDFVLKMRDDNSFGNQGYKTYWRLPQLEWISHEGKIIVKNILMFENIEDDFSLFCDKYVLDLSLPHINKNPLKPNKHYSEYYDDQSMEIVEQMCKLDIDYFNYKFKM